MGFSSRSNVLPLLFLIVVLGMSLGPVSALYSKGDAVIQLTGKTFGKVIKSPHVVIAEFYAPWCGHCKSLAPEYKAAAKKLKGLAKVVSIDCDVEANKATCGKYDVKGFPTIKIFNAGTPKGMPEDYNGARTSAGLVAAAIAKLPTKHVTKLGKGGVDMKKFVEDSTKGCVILISDKKAIPALFKALSLEFLSQLSFGFLSSTDPEVVETLKLTQFPHVMVVPRNGNPPASYTDKMGSEALIEFISEKAGIPRGAKRDPVNDKDPKKDAPPPPPKREFDPKIPELTSQQTLEEECVKKSGVCIISFLLPQDDEGSPESVKEHQANLEVIGALKKKYFDKKNDAFTFVWVNVSGHGQKLMRDFDVSDQLPGMLALNSGKKVFRNFRAAFDESGIGRFLDDLYSGRGRNSKFVIVPTLDKAAAPKVAKKEEL